MLKNSIIVGGILLPAFAFSQELKEDTTKVFPIKSIDPVYYDKTLQIITLRNLEGLRREDIEALNTDDVAGLISKAPGATVKSYGSLGGLKTVSIRGLGGEHTSLVVDGFQVSNAQAGQMNLGQLQSDGLTRVTAGLKQNFAATLPVASNFSGNYIGISTFLNSSYRTTQNVKASVRYGSFMRREAYVQGDKKTEKWHVGAFGKYRDANGGYPYEFLNGATPTDGVRNNNDYRDMHFGFKLGRDFSPNKKLRVIYRSSFIDQGLPGAVIFYNESADERMNTQDHRVMVDYAKSDLNNSYRFYANAGSNNLQYIDPTQLSTIGAVHDHYNNFSLNGGYIHYKQLKKLELKWGAEERLDVLQTNRETLGQPLRVSTFGLFGAKKRLGNFDFEAIAGGQLVYDENSLGNNTHLQFTPNVFSHHQFLNNKHSAEFSYKRNFRLPSFNELYFGAVGNDHLQPEIAHQFNLGWDWRIKESYYRWRWEVSTQGYFNRVRNKIVAIPTKNLFVWSMQNVAEAEVYGGILETRATRRLRNNMRLEFLGNYTYQRVIDITPNAITYGHQVAYAPEHTANADVMFVGKGFNVRISNNFVSSRYALNQNVPVNRLDPFWTMDASVGYKYTMKNKHKFGVQFNVRNVTNTSYAFIRSYLMPGRHYLLTLKYEIL